MIRSFISILGFALLTVLAPAQEPQGASARLDSGLLELPAIGAEDDLFTNLDDRLEESIESQANWDEWTH